MFDAYPAFGMGFPVLTDLATLVARIVVGGMFFLSGLYKLFTAASAEKMRTTMVEVGIVAPRQTARFVSVCELVCGALLVAGLATSLSAGVLAVVSLVALITVAIKSVEGASFGYRLSSYLDLPETLLLVILAGVIVAGPGLYSVDAAVFEPEPRFLTNTVPAE